MQTIIFATGCFCFGVGIAVFWANPGSLPNRIFGFIAVLVTAWLWSVVGAINAGELYWIDGVTSPVPWLRMNGATSSMLGWGIWCLNEAFERESGMDRRTARNLALACAGCTVLAILACTTDLYVPADSTPQHNRRGLGYAFYVTLGVAVHLWLLGRTCRQLRRQTGLRRVQIVFLSLNLSVTFLLVMLATTAGSLLQLSWLRRSSCFIFFASFVLAAWAITFHQVFNARQIFLSLGQRVGLVLAAGVGITSSWEFFGRFLPSPADFLASLALCASAGLWIDRKSREWLRLGNEQAIREMRRETITIARTEPHAEGLVAAFEQLLRKHCDVGSATLLPDGEELRAGSALRLARDRPAYAALCELGWATPESLERRPASPGVAQLREFLRQHALGLIVVAPRGSPAPTLLVALGPKHTPWPFTYPEVQCVQVVAELMDNVLTRSRLTAQAALRAKIEHLAMMSRGLAHDLRNLITPISSYLVHTRDQCPPGSVEEEVHAAAGRSVKIMTDYIREAAFFANRLTPHFQAVRLAEVMSAAGELTAERAARRGARVDIAADDIRLTADGVLLQRLLVNLINNAIDAIQPGGRISVRALRAAPQGVRLLVVDDGCGIAAEHLARIFEPYFTTKELADEVRGFGLGLTICEKIAHLHRGTIRVESAVGCGTSFIVDLPVSQPGSAAGRAAEPLALAGALPS